MYVIHRFSFLRNSEIAGGLVARWAPRTSCVMEEDPTHCAEWAAAASDD
jgi:hypothetical protein